MGTGNLLVINFSYSPIIAVLLYPFLNVKTLPPLCPHNPNHLPAPHGEVKTRLCLYNPGIATPGCWWTLQPSKMHVKTHFKNPIYMVVELWSTKLAKNSEIVRCC